MRFPSITMRSWTSSTQSTKTEHQQNQRLALLNTTKEQMRLSYQHSIFDEMYWQQQYYNSIMRSAMNHHFKAILQEKGYMIDVNETEAMHKIDTKKLKEEVKANNIEVFLTYYK